MIILILILNELLGPIISNFPLELFPVSIYSAYLLVLKIFWKDIIILHYFSKLLAISWISKRDFDTHYIRKNFYCHQETHPSDIFLNLDVKHKNIIYFSSIAFGNMSLQKFIKRAIFVYFYILEALLWF